MNLPFYKYQGTGNDFVMLDNRTNKYEDQLTREQIAFLCDRRMGIGADGLILLSPSETEDFRMIYYNSDGGESAMCGNGGRCLVAFAHYLGVIGSECTFDAVDGLHHASIEGEIVTLEMQVPQGYQKLNGNTVWLNTGSPHYVRFDEKSVLDLNVYQEGKQIRYSEPYLSQGGTNVNFVNVLESNRLKVRTYERGVEDETLSCGTGVTACAYAHLVETDGVGENVEIEVKGGKLEVIVKDRGTDQEKVFLKGPATYVFAGEILM